MWVLPLSTAVLLPIPTSGTSSKVWQQREKLPFGVFLFHFLVCRWSARKEIRTGRAGEENGSGNGLEELVTFYELRALFLCDMIGLGWCPVLSAQGRAFSCLHLCHPGPQAPSLPSPPLHAPRPCEWWELGPCLEGRCSRCPRRNHGVRSYGSMEEPREGNAPSPSR